jgi:hypothetical protein
MFCYILSDQYTPLLPFHVFCLVSVHHHEATKYKHTHINSVKTGVYVIRIKNIMSPVTVNEGPVKYESKMVVKC